MSLRRYCEMMKAKDQKWYLLIGDDFEDAGPEDSTAHGPFASESKTERYLEDNFSNPGGLEIDDSGTQDVPSDVKKPQRNSLGPRF